METVTTGVEENLSLMSFFLYSDLSEKEKRYLLKSLLEIQKRSSLQYGREAHFNDLFLAVRYLQKVTLVHYDELSLPNFESQYFAERLVEVEPGQGQFSKDQNGMIYADEHGNFNCSIVGFACRFEHEIAFLGDPTLDTLYHELLHLTEGVKSFYIPAEAYIFNADIRTMLCEGRATYYAGMLEREPKLSSYDFIDGDKENFVFASPQSYPLEFNLYEMLQGILGLDFLEEWAKNSETKDYLFLADQKLKNELGIPFADVYYSLVHIMEQHHFDELQERENVQVKEGKTFRVQDNITRAFLSIVPYYQAKIKNLKEEQQRYSDQGSYHCNFEKKWQDYFERVESRVAHLQKIQTDTQYCDRCYQEAYQELLKERALLVSDQTEDHTPEIQEFDELLPKATIMVYRQEKQQELEMVEKDVLSNRRQYQQQLEEYNQIKNDFKLREQYYDSFLNSPYIMESPVACYCFLENIYRRRVSQRLQQPANVLERAELHQIYSDFKNRVRLSQDALACCQQGHSQILPANQKVV